MCCICGGTKRESNTRKIQTRTHSHSLHSQWAAPFVVVKKKANGKVQICADNSTGLDNSLDPHQYLQPVPEDIFAKLNGGIFFTKIGFSNAFLQLEVEEESEEFLIINSPKICSDLTVLASKSNKHQPYSTKQWTLCWPDWQELLHYWWHMNFCSAYFPFSAKQIIRILCQNWKVLIFPGQNQRTKMLDNQTQQIPRQ